MFTYTMRPCIVNRPMLVTHIKEKMYQDPVLGPSRQLHPGRRISCLRQKALNVLINTVRVLLLKPLSVSPTRVAYQA